MISAMNNPSGIRKIWALILLTIISISGSPDLTLSQQLPGKNPVGFTCKNQLNHAMGLMGQAFAGLEMLSESVDARVACLDNMDWVFNLAIDYFGSWDRYHPDQEFCRALSLGFAVEGSQNCKYRFAVDVETGETGCKLWTAKDSGPSACPFLDFTMLGSDYSCCIQWNMIHYVDSLIVRYRQLAAAVWRGYEFRGCVGKDEQREAEYYALEYFYGQELTDIRSRYGYSDFTGKCKLIPLDPITPEKKPAPDMDEAGIE